MPAESVPAIIAILTMFAVFIVALGGVSLWTYLPERRQAERIRRDSDTAAAKLATGR